MNPKINKNNHNIFLPSKQMLRSNKPSYTKNPTNPRNCKPINKISKFENPTNKTQKNPSNLACRRQGLGMICR